MERSGIRQEPVDKWILKPVRKFISNSSTSGILLFSSALLAIILTNSPWGTQFQHIWEHEFYVGYNQYMIKKSLHHWINDGLMAVFFFVVGLELKREIIAGELNEPRKAILPLAGAIGGMVIPALIYAMFNLKGEAAGGWGIPMATDIAFALGILYLLGDRVPVSLKIFLTALAIADDLGAVLVIAFFYTSEIDVDSLLSAGALLLLLVISNRMGVRSTLYYAIIGIGGVWLFFLMSGVHATIAAVLAAFTIPANTKISGEGFVLQVEGLVEDFKKAKTNNKPTVTHEQLHVLANIRDVSKLALTPLQRLEHAMHPFVAYLVLPVFALSNAGMKLDAGLGDMLLSPVVMGIFFGLLLGKLIGVAGIIQILISLRVAQLPKGMTGRHLVGVGLLAGIGFTMSLFVTDLAFDDEFLISQAKLGILAASLVASFAGYFVIKWASKRPGIKEEK
ncbi:Na+/H+ antiporter NhaA [Pollutibacter soli]|uniref:Na+/H+ antiporter NhaA n=1 Tax=Pollutibacter soli TaxID=3034157 RepID=UPI003013D4C1